MKIHLINDSEFADYGRVFPSAFAVQEMVEILKQIDAPSESVVYEPSEENLEQAAAAAQIRKSLFGGLPIQVGYCNGTNYKLNAVEYHRSSEVGIAASDLILLLGKQQDVTENFSYDSSKLQAFFVPEGTVYELYATTLHYAPCCAGNHPFRNVVILPEGTNTELSEPADLCPEDRLMTAKNKWLIAHKEAGIAGAFIGITGENISV